MSVKTYATQDIRNVAITGHSDTGKTSLVSAMLFDSGASTRLLKVDDGNTITDFDEDEHDRKITISTAIAHIEHTGCKINLIEEIDGQQIHALLAANYFSRQKIEAIAERTGITAIRVPMGPGVEGIDDYFELVDLWVNSLAEAFGD